MISVSRGGLGQEIREDVPGEFTSEEVAATAGATSASGSNVVGLMLGFMSTMMFFTMMMARGSEREERERAR